MKGFKISLDLKVMISNFNLRVYGLLIENNAVLVTDEHRGGVEMTKFPGGGLEKGEGLVACLAREFDEELKLEVIINDLFYVNDFLQVSAFDPTDQLISFYYFVSTNYSNKIDTVKKRKKPAPNEQTFRWVPIADLKEDDFTFPIDQVVCQKLKAQFIP